MGPTSRLSVEVACQRAEKAAKFLAADPRVRLVFFFGSAADPERTLPVGDVDLAILTDRSLDLYELLALQGDAALAAGGDVDLILLNDAPVVLAHEVAETGQCLYADPPEAETDFVVRAYMKYFDFKYYLDLQWRLMKERQEERRRGLPG